MNKYLYGGILTICIILFSFYVLNVFDFGPRSNHYIFTRSTDLSNEQLSGISLNEKVQIHTNNFTTWSKESYSIYENIKPGVSISTKKEDDFIERIWAYGNSNGITSKGISINDSVKRVKEVYGDNFYLRNEQGARIIGYIDKSKGITLEFWLFEGLVNAIRLDKSYME